MRISFPELSPRRFARNLPAVAVVCVLLLLAFLGAPAFALPQKLGDLDEDGLSTVLDLARLNALIAGTVPFTAVSAIYADLNKDGFVNDADRAELLKEILQTRTPQALPLATVRSTSPFAGESNIALTRETILNFTIPLSLTATLDTANFYAEFGGTKILSRVEISADRKKATLFFLEPLPASVRPHVVFDSTGLTDLLGRAVDGDGDGQPGGVLTFTYDTAPLTPVPATGIIGKVLASERGAGGADVPIAGALVRVVGSETLFTFTAADGSFALTPCPAGRFFVEVDGRTSPASHFPDGGYYPYIVKAWEALPGRADNLAAGTGKIFLPFVAAATLQPVSATQTTPVSFPPAVIAANPALAGVEIYVPANSLFADDGTRGGKVGLAPVASDRLPEPLPPGLHHALDISIQTDGPTNFDRPVPVRFPNLPDPVTGVKLKPGEKSALWSYNHDKGAWEIAGPMTVTDDGNFVVTDVGVGVRQPGWHGAMPGGQMTIPPGIGGDPSLPPIPKPPKTKPKPPRPDPNPNPDPDPNPNPDPIPDPDPPPDPNPDPDPRYEDVKIRIRTFIPSSAVVLDLAGTDLLGFAYAGDGRGFSPSAGTSRTDQTITVSVSKENPIIASLRRYSSQTKKYSLESTIVLDGKPWWYRSLKPGSVPIATTTAQHNDSNSTATITKVGKNRLMCNFVISIHNELQPFAPNLDYEINFDLRGQSDGRIYYLANGVHDGFPAYEIYINGNLIYSHDPLAKGQSPLSLAPPMEFAFVGINGLLGTASAQRSTLAANAFTPPAVQSQPVTGTYYYVVETIPDGLVVARGHQDAQSALNLVLGEATRYRIRGYFLNTGHTFTRSFELVSAGQRIVLDDLLVGMPSDEYDGDNDGLPDFAELVIGTKVDDPDSDGDGINDGTEVSEGSNPLDGKPAIPGLISTIDTPGQAKDIAAQNTVAVLADGSEGVSVFNVVNALNPVRTAQVRLAGSVEAVALDGKLAAATGSSLSLLDLSDLSNVRVTRQLSLGSTPRSVAAAGGIAYAGLDSGQIVAVDMSAGAELERLQVTTESIHDLVFAGDVLYARTASRVYAVEFAPAGMAVSGSVAVNGATNSTRLRLFAAGGLAYAPFTQGYTILSLADPLHPTVAQTVSTTQFGWREVVPTGSGLGLGVVANAGADADLNLYNFGANGTGSTFLTTFTTPGDAQAVSIYNGLAYVADGSAGLTVVNYKAYDTLGVPPTINLTTGFTNVGGAFYAEEGKLGRMTAAVNDDVQVRNVEFYIDDQLVVADGNFPFEHRFITPLREQAAAAAAAAQKLAASKPSGTCCGGRASAAAKTVAATSSPAAAATPPKTTFTLKARATDTGGNSTWSSTITVNLVADATAPRVVKFQPLSGSFTGTLRDVAATFSEPIDQSTLTTASFTLTGAGPDGLFGTADDTTPVGTLSYREAKNTAFLSFAANLPPSVYRLTVKAPLADLAGNVIAAPAQTQFRVFSFTDSDGDGIPDDVEPLLGLNPSNPDSNGNGVRDGDEDNDHDGLRNAAEIAFGLNPLNPDSNGNGILDGDEDSDHDGLKNSREALAGTDPTNADTDGDGWNDEAEVTGGSNPLNARSRPFGLIASEPATNIVRVGDLTSGILANASIVAQPQVFLARMVSDPGSPNGGLGRAAFISTPTVFAARTASDPNDPLNGLGRASFMATPTVFIARTSNPADPDGGTGRAAFMATPQVFIARPMSDPGGPNGGLGSASFIATPPVNILRLDGAGTFIAKPPVTVEIQNP